MKVLFRAGFDTISGYGRDAVDIARYLRRSGWEVTPWPISLFPGLPAEFLQMLEPEPHGKHDVVLTFAPPFDIHPLPLLKFADVRVGYTMWEKSRMIPADFDGHGWEPEADYDEESEAPPPRPMWDHVNRWAPLDLMLVTCRMNVDALRAVDQVTQMAVVPCGVDTTLWPSAERDPARRLTFGMIGMLNGRKDPFVAIDAFRELKEEHPGFDARFEFKTNTAGLHPKIMEWVPDVTIHDTVWTTAQVRDWYYGIDVLVSTSRGEGNNKPAMEFMCSGGPVIATEWSGHENWLYDEAGYPLHGKLVYDARGVGDFRADKAHLKELMLRCWKERSEVTRKGIVAGSVIRSTLSWERVIEQMRHHIERVMT